MRTLALLAAAAAIAVTPDRAAVGETVTVTGPRGAAVTLVPLETAAAPAPLGRIGADGRLRAAVPDVPHGSYRVVVEGERESVVLEVAALSQETSLLLLGFGAVLVLGLVAAGVVVHRRWRDAIS